MSNPSEGPVSHTNSLFRPSILNVSSDFPRPSNGLSTASTASENRSTSTATTVSSVVTPAVEVPPQKSVPSDYVFGSNISSRVVNAGTACGASASLGAMPSDQSSSSVFTALAQAVSSKPIESNSETLAESVNKITEVQKHSALNLSEIDPFTGEEDETSIFRQHCRAYIFDTDKQKWNSLGGSHFHLNDSKPEQSGDRTINRSRIVVRLASTKRVIINSPIWTEMPVALVNSRNIRVGALSEDGGHIRSYLFSFPSDELASDLFESLNIRKERVEKLKCKEDKPPTPSGLKRPTDQSGEGPSPKQALSGSTSASALTTSSSTSDTDALMSAEPSASKLSAKSPLKSAETKTERCTKDSSVAQEDSKLPQSQPENVEDSALSHTEPVPGECSHSENQQPLDPKANRSV